VLAVSGRESGKIGPDGENWVLYYGSDVAEPDELHTLSQSVVKMSLSRTEPWSSRQSAGSIMIGIKSQFMFTQVVKNLSR
jgi:hypothetical protein